MSKRTVPDTSMSAFKQLTPEFLSSHYGMILHALSKLKTANYEAISSSCRLDKTACGRRLSELEKMGLIWKPGGKTMTSTGRSSYVWQLSAETEAILPPVEKSMKGTTVAQHSKKIKELSTPFIQPSLF